MCIYCKNFGHEIENCRRQLMEDRKEKQQVDKNKQQDKRKETQHEDPPKGSLIKPTKIRELRQSKIQVP